VFNKLQRAGSAIIHIFAVNLHARTLRASRRCISLPAAVFPHFPLSLFFFYAYCAAVLFLLGFNHCLSRSRACSILRLEGTDMGGQDGLSSRTGGLMHFSTTISPLATRSLRSRAVQLKFNKMRKPAVYNGKRDAYFVLFFYFLYIYIFRICFFSFLLFSLSLYTYNCLTCIVQFPVNCPLRVLLTRANFYRYAIIYGRDCAING